MKFINAILSGFRNYAVFAGRANRRECWLWLVFVGLGWLVLNFVDLFYVAPMMGFAPFEDGAGSPVSTIWLILCLLPTLAVIARRLHDHDKSAWLALALAPLPFWLAAKGKKGQNRFG